MVRIPRVSISMLELDRLKCIQGLIGKPLKQKVVAERLRLTVRQVWLLVERCELVGPRGLISKLRDRPGNRRLKPPACRRSLCHHPAQHADFGRTLAAEWSSPLKDRTVRISRSEEYDLCPEICLCLVHKSRSLLCNAVVDSVLKRSRGWSKRPCNLG